MEIKVVTDNDKEFVMSIDKHVNDKCFILRQNRKEIDKQ